MKNNKRNDSTKGILLLTGFVLATSLSVLGILYLKNKDKTFYAIEATYIDPNTSENIILDTSPKKHLYCLSIEEAQNKVQEYSKHPDYHVFKPRRMTVSQSIFYFC